MFHTQFSEIELIKNQITSAIEQVTMNGINLKTLGISKTALDENNDLTSENGMLKEYKRLLVVLKQLQILKKRTAEQIENAKREVLELHRDIDKYTNVNVSLFVLILFLCIELILKMLTQALRAEAAEKYDQASSQLEDLKHKKSVTENVVDEAKSRNEEIKDQLRSNENYRQISHLEERLSDIIEDTKISTATLDQLQKVIYIYSEIHALELELEFDFEYILKRFFIFFL